MGRGYIRQRGNGSYQVIVYAGQDPLTGKDRRLTGTAQTRKEAERLRTRLLSEVDEGRVSGNNATVAQVLQRWLETVDHEFTTRQANEALITTKILPALGAVPARKLTVEAIERFYAELRKRGGVEGRPLSGSSVRRVHAILRAGLERAVKWGWIPSNPAALAAVPRSVRPDVDPPTPEGIARFLETAWASDPDLGVLIWVAMVTGARRGELCGLRWPHVRLPEGYMLIARSVVQRGGERREKATKTHQARRIALDERTIVILEEHRARCEARAEACGVTIRSDGYVFSLAVDGSEPVLPDSVTQRIRRLSNRLGVCVTLRGLRHYAATQMLTGGVDLRTAAGRLGHSDGGTTTLRVYTHFLPTPDQRAAELLAGTVPHPQPSKE